MIVVLMPIFMLKSSDAVSKIHFPCQPGIAYYLHRPIDGGQADPGMSFFDEFVKLFNRRMPLGLQEYIQNLLTLFAVEHAFVFEILPENIELSVYANHMDARIVEYTKREDYKPVFISPSSNCEDIKSVMHKDSEEEPIYLVVASQVATILVSLKNKTVYFIAYDNFELDEDIPLD